MLLVWAAINAHKIFVSASADKPVFYFALANQFVACPEKEVLFF